jgi:exopolyphosphatase/guanosine-5'-triphosphate,3'-diphosphate pyrophosphatase
MKSMPLASIDIGTNTFRLLIAKVRFDRSRNNYAIKEIYSERIITRLGEGIPEKGYIREEAIEKGIEVLKRFRENIDRHGAYRTSAIATSALRDAKNSVSFIKRVHNATGLDIHIISGEEEARKTASGMLMDMKLPETALMIDIGGGSTELIFTNLRRLLFIKSLNLGVVYLACRYMKNDPPLKKDLKSMESEISSNIMPLKDTFKNFFSKNTVFIGTAGTVTALSAITQKLTRYDHNKIHNSKITKEKIEKIFFDISTISSQERMRYLPFEPARLDIIVPGTLILLKIMESFGFKKVNVSNYGLREGILFDLYEKNN